MKMRYCLLGRLAVYTHFYLAAIGVILMGVGFQLAAAVFLLVAWFLLFGLLMYTVTRPEVDDAIAKVLAELDRRYLP